ncbi:MAG: hypothetical protein IBX69_17115 [Anaerolineales bacterium]|nr:hypothetical protein [Anaerolineales bacterium]
MITELLPSVEEKEIVLSKSKFKIEDITWNPENHQWAGGTTYENLIKNDLLGTAKRHIPLFFASATSFYSYGVHLPFVLPELVINSWVHNWNKFSSMAFQDILLGDVQESIGGSYYKTKREVVRYGKAIIIGGVGKTAPLSSSIRTPVGRI